MAGDATWIAMEIEALTGFFRFDREEALNWCTFNIDKEYVDNYSESYKKLYTRSKWGKKDVITTVTLHDLTDLSSLVYIPWAQEDMNKNGGPKTYLEYNHPETNETLIYKV
jgi:hypothetical protein